MKCIHVHAIITSAKEDVITPFVILWCHRPFVVICASVSNFAQKRPYGFAWNFQGWLWAGEQMIKFWWLSAASGSVWRHC